MYSIVKYINDSVTKINNSANENDMQYYHGRATAFLEIMYNRDPCRRDYRLTLNEIDEAVRQRRLQGFPQ